MTDEARIIALTDEWRRYYDFLDLRFTVEQAQALATAGYDVIGYVATTSLPLSALTGVQG